MSNTAYMQRSQCFFNISFISLKKILVFALEFDPPLSFSIALALKNTSLSGRIILTRAAKKEMPAAVKNKLLHPFAALGTRYKLMRAAIR